MTPLTPVHGLTGPLMTPQEYGVGARFTLSVYDSDYIDIILSALADAPTDGLTLETGDISTFVTGSEQRICEYLTRVIARAAATGVHVSAAILLSRGCPGELVCELPPGVPAIGAEPVDLRDTGIRARAHWSIYPLLDGGDESAGDHMVPIYRAIEGAKEQGVFAGSDHFATRLDGDLARILETVANAWIEVGAKVQHVVTHVTVSLNSPTLGQ